MKNKLLVGLTALVLASGCSGKPKEPLTLEQSVQSLNENYKRKITHYNQVKPLVEEAVLKFFGEEGLKKSREYEVKVMGRRSFERRFPSQNKKIVRLGMLVESKKTAYVVSGPACEVLPTIYHEIAGHPLTTQDENSPIADINALLARLPKETSGESKQEWAEKLKKKLDIIQDIDKIRKQLYTRETLEKKLMEEAGAYAVERLIGTYLMEEYKIKLRFPSEVNYSNLHSVAACIMYDVSDYLSHKNPNQDPYKTLKQTWNRVNTAHYGEIKEIIKPDTKIMAERFFKKNIKK